MRKNIILVSILIIFLMIATPLSCGMSSLIRTKTNLGPLEVVITHPKDGEYYVFNTLIPYSDKAREGKAIVEYWANIEIDIRGAWSSSENVYIYFYIDGANVSSLHKEDDHKLSGGWWDSASYNDWKWVRTKEHTYKVRAIDKGTGVEDDDEIIISGINIVSKEKSSKNSEKPLIYDMISRFDDSYTNFLPTLFYKIQTTIQRVI